MPITISGHKTFLICDDLGNIREGTVQGLYHEDSRFLSTFDLRFDGQPPIVLTARQVNASASAHFLTNPALADVPSGQISLTRQRVVGDGMREEIEAQNYGGHEVRFDLSLRLDTDFRHVFDAKDEPQVNGEAVRHEESRLRSEDDGGRTLRLRIESVSRLRETVVRFSQAPTRVDGDVYHFALTLAPQNSWRLMIEVLTLKNDNVGMPLPPLSPATLVGEASAQGVVRAPAQRDYRVRQSLSQGEEWSRRLIARAPRLETDSLVLRRAYEQSVADFAALHISGRDAGIDDEVIAAGIPWFKTLFGRDALITSYQALPFFADSARGTLRALARLQGSGRDVVRGEEPGKILHEWRSPTFVGTQGSPSVFPYYGTIDATPLFLIVLASHYEVTRDIAFQEEMCEPALRALKWMEQYGDRDGDGYLEYQRESDTTWGLDNQGWKDSGDAVRFANGTLAEAPIALCEVQGYAYAAWQGMARVFEALGDDVRASSLRERAAQLKERFNVDFWLPEREFYAFALDGKKRQVDSLVSNPGHLLWSGIVDERRAPEVARRLLSKDMFAGWGIRTMGQSEGGYNPMSYHCGSIWPHDNSLIVAGLARYGFVREAERVIAGLLRALEFSPDYRLPELFAGYGMDETPFPVEYPTACRPQAWAAGAVFLLISTLMRVDLAASARSASPLLVPGVNWLRLSGVWLDGHRADVELDARIDEAVG
ncbi:MAG TPA: glycogen debranching N-terminal domain-containing protein [Ktedonobacterales bacterium]|jgi:glycogen debranching enzyme|nr:glycogen debranching N-terminal domain-containing protein [Ktedonobacterales bacterium]